MLTQKVAESWLPAGVRGGEELEVQNVQVRFSKERMERGGRGIGKINRFGVNMSLG